MPVSPQTSPAICHQKKPPLFPLCSDQVSTFFSSPADTRTLYHGHPCPSLTFWLGPECRLNAVSPAVHTWHVWNRLVLILGAHRVVLVHHCRRDDEPAVLLVRC